MHVPSAWEFVHEFIAHYVALEGKLWKSLGYLIFKPGFLTRAYIEGKRARYLEPLRLYLTFSILFFAILKLTPMHVGGSDLGEVLREAEAGVEQSIQGQRQAGSAQAAPGSLAAAEPANEAVRKARSDAALKVDLEADLAGVQLATGKPEEFKDKTATLAGEFNPAWKDKVYRFFELPSEQRNQAFKRAFFGYTPYAIFALMPVFALLLKLLYLGTGRRYGEHFLFALHTNAFAYLTLGLWKLIPSSWPYIGGLLGFWLVAYLPVAMRRVYGGSRLMTGVRWIVLMVLHLITILFAVLLVMSQAVFS